MFVAGDDTLVLAGGNCATPTACYNSFVAVRPSGMGKADPGQTISLSQQPGLYATDGTPTLQYDTEGKHVTNQIAILDGVLYAFQIANNASSADPAMWRFPLVARVDPGAAGVDAVGNGGATPFKTIAFAMKRSGRPITALAGGTYGGSGNVDVSVQGPIASGAAKSHCASQPDVVGCVPSYVLAGSRGAVIDCGAGAASSSAASTPTALDAGGERGLYLTGAVRFYGRGFEIRNCRARDGAAVYFDRTAWSNPAGATYRFVSRRRGVDG